MKSALLFLRCELRVWIARAVVIGRRLRLRYVEFRAARARRRLAQLESLMATDE